MTDKLSKDEKKISNAFNRGDFVSVKKKKKVTAEYQSYAEAALAKDKITQRELVDAAIKQALLRPEENGYAGAAALRLSNGEIITSIFFTAPNETVSLCHETGAICEAHRRGINVTASVCVSRENSSASFIVLPPCGVCQERLALWGPNVEVAVPSEASAESWEFKKLSEVHAYYWSKPFLWAKMK